MVSVDRHPKVNLGSGQRVLRSAMPVLISFEFLYICVLFGFPIDAVPVIGEYSFFTNVFFGLAATVYGTFSYYKLSWKLPRLVFLTLVVHLTFTMLVAFNMLYTIDVFHIAVRKVALLLFGGTWAILGAGLIVGNSKGPQRFVKAMLIYGMLFTFMNMLLPAASGGLARTVLTENYQHASRASGLGVIACLAILSQGNLKLFKKGWIIALLIFGLMAQLSAGGRTGLGASFICIFIFLIINIRFSQRSFRINKRFFLYMMFAVIGLVGLVYLISTGWRPATINRFLIILEGASDLNVSFNNRVGRFSKFGDLFFQAPLFGHGTGSWDEISGEVDSYYPHNLIIELFVEHGMFGALLFLLPMLYYLVKFLRNSDYRNHYTHFAMLLYFSYVLITVMFTGDLGLNMYLYSGMAMLAVRPASTVAKPHERELAP